MQDICMLKWTSNNQVVQCLLNHIYNIVCKPAYGGQSKGHQVVHLNWTIQLELEDISLISSQSTTEIGLVIFSRWAVGHRNKLSSDIPANSLQSFETKLDTLFKGKCLVFFNIGEIGW